MRTLEGQGRLQTGEGRLSSADSGRRESVFPSPEPAWGTERASHVRARTRMCSARGLGAAECASAALHALVSHAVEQPSFPLPPPLQAVRARTWRPPRAGNRDTWLHCFRRRCRRPLPLQLPRRDPAPAPNCVGFVPL